MPREDSKASGVPAAKCSQFGACRLSVAPQPRAGEVGLRVRRDSALASTGASRRSAGAEFGATMPRMTQATDTVSALKTIPLLAGLPHADLVALAKKVTEASYAVGTELIKEGTSGSSVFLIVSGECEVRRHQRRIRTLGVGQFFGELSIIDPAPRTASVRVTEAATVLILEGKDFRTALKSNMQMAQRLIVALAERLRHMTDDFSPRAKT